MSIFEGRVAVVTGASRGIGRAVAFALGASGAQVVALARTVGGLEELDDAICAAGGPKPVLVPLDITDFPALDRLGAALFERYGKVDALVGNAGVLGQLSPLGHVDPKVWDQVMAINVTANWRLLRSLDPLLKRSDAGRAVFITSGAARSAKAYWGPYSVSKSALDTLIRTYAAETRQTHVKANLFNPGPVRTHMRAAAMPGEDPQTLPAPDELVPHILALLQPAMSESGRIYDFPARSFAPIAA